MSAVITNLDVAIQVIRSNPRSQDILTFITDHPNEIKTISLRFNSSILHEILKSGNAALLKQVIEIPGVWFPLHSPFSTDPRNTHQIWVESRARLGEWNSKSMEIFLNFLYEWDSYCEIAKNYLDTTQERLWAWLRRNFEYCYKTPPSRKWSIAMQVVYYGDLANLQNLLRICPPGDDQNIWTIRGNDGSTLLDVAEILNQEKYRASEAVAAKIHEIYEFVRIRTLEPNRQQTPAVVVPAVDPNDPLSHVRSIWAEITATKVSRGEGECSIMYCGTEPLYSCSRDCNHAFSKEGLCSFIQSTLRTGPFPVHCPGCTTISSAHDRGLITRGPIKGLVQEGVIQEIDGMRLLHQQIRSLADEPSIDLQFSLSKLCPFCSAPVAHYKYHGIHHISPMGGCSNCQKHFCFSCLQSNGDGTYWEGCPSGCHVNCSNDCDCPLCPDCKLNESCQFCYGCPKCYPGRY